MSELLRLLTKNEQMSESLVFLSESLIRSFLGQTSDLLRKQMSKFPALVFSYFSQKNAQSKAEKISVSDLDPYWIRTTVNDLPDPYSEFGSRSGSSQNNM